jgi:hypothetical protein
MTVMNSRTLISFVRPLLKRLQQRTFVVGGRRKGVRGYNDELVEYGKVNLREESGKREGTEARHICEMPASTLDCLKAIVVKLVNPRIADFDGERRKSVP